LLRLFKEINQDGQTLLMVTHSVKAASHAKRVLFMMHGPLGEPFRKQKQKQHYSIKRKRHTLTF